MKEYVYTLKNKKDRNEYHLFRGEKNKDGGCTSENKSICKKMDWIKNNNYFSCEEEKNARTKCAEKGREACGTCVSHLYNSYS